ncbi:16S rRNA (uracil(1498)-N(3))-methyltransferase [Geomonas subterranea]|uniref:Ribosomal RNA small subunit methyltransferase E n=1 Tax=Geomonas subterranea TaxID=2847989 RepID=A0ABX8LCM2_9BACT|nr:16S rRNA (uracil(1498)-N(3))-methyltransferase [Geomonas subterranea]QXE89780.1 16S rRNA (uracil(1498)-N(3))-methyltransferase [Geomonas subterranea]QXM08102.1 16S rRNA (uracil(1498)-N(3))-methyltransferase [Geomonas subterranea]
MRSFFLGDNEVHDGEATVTGELYRHMARVLRLKQGAEVELVDNDGRRHCGVIEEVGAKSLTVRIAATSAAPGPEPGLRITLYQGLPKGDKLDLILQKCTELGISEVVTFDATRSVVKLRGEKTAAKLARFEKIVQEAARQSGRNSAPRTVIGGTLKEVLRDTRHAVKLLLWEGEEKTTLRECLERYQAPESVAVVVGPEGGLSAEEVEAAVACGFTPVTLGKRILRTETAGLALVSILQFHWGDMG